MKNIGFIIQSIRLWHRDSLSGLAEKVQMSKGFLSEVENNKKQPSVEIIEKIANNYGMSGWAVLRLAEAYEGELGSLSADVAKTELILGWLEATRDA